MLIHAVPLADAFWEMVDVLEAGAERPAGAVRLPRRSHPRQQRQHHGMTFRPHPGR